MASSTRKAETSNAAKAPLRIVTVAVALGLLAAIPAVVAYNRFTNQMATYGNRLEGFADEFSAILSRQIEAGG